MKKRFLFLLIILFIPLNIHAEEITKDCTIRMNNERLSQNVYENSEKTSIKVEHNSTLTIKSEKNIQGLYLIYELNGGKGSISNGKEVTTFNNNEFLHNYIDISNIFGLSNELSLTFKNDTFLTEIYVIGEGDIPSFVEIWNPPVEKADLILFSTHSDDEQLFFAGLLPYYVAKGANVQVVYFASHNDNLKRLHEQLHGLYEVGIRNYPIMGYVPDAYSENLKDAIANMKSDGITTDDAQKFLVTQIRRFKPLVIVGHDEKGEYSHGQHILNTYLLERAIDQANNSEYDEESYKKYGNWATKKMYIHLYPKNEITLPIDEPLDYFNGKSAFQVTQDGFRKHESQQWTWFHRWIYGDEKKDEIITKASEIETYSPLKYGLFRSLVGYDEEKNDMFEHLSFYKDMEDENAYFASLEIKEVKEKAMEYNDTQKETKTIIVFVITILSGIAILYLVRKY